MKTRLVQEYFDDSARRYPTRTAVTDGKNTICYDGLSSFSNQLAHCLKSLGVSRQDRVVICMRRCVDYLAAILGSLKSDAAYVPVDNKAPPGRWETIIEDCQPTALICDGFTLDAIRNSVPGLIGNLPMISLDSNSPGYGESSSSIVSRDQVSGYETGKPEYENDENDMAHIIYTSGSTGKPKGVMISHLNIKTYIDWAVDCFHIGVHDRILSTAPFYFDMSTFDIYCSFKSGATLCIAKDELMLFPQKLIQFVEQEKVTMWKGISSLLMYMSMVGVTKKGLMPTLRQILFAGEVMHPKYLIDWMETYPDKLFYNCYGPTEATGISLFHRVDQIPADDQAKIPIGKPCKKNTNVLLLNEDNSLTKTGDVGELCISGPCLSKGYFNDREKTERAFIQDLLLNPSPKRIYKTGDLARMNDDGDYEFVARKDHQVKYMGYRIELSEIERNLVSMEKIKDAAVLLLESEHQGVDELVAFVESYDDIIAADVIGHMRKQLPPYMIPKQWITMDKIPRCNRGKISREALEAYYRNMRRAKSC